jgi:hypothetical protein
MTAAKHDSPAAWRSPLGQLVRIPADPLQAIEIHEPFLRETFRPLTNVENVENKKAGQ